MYTFYPLLISYMTNKAKLNRNLQLGGLLSEGGSLERSFPTAKIEVPEDVVLDRTNLVWKTGATAKKVEPGKPMLLDFISLNDADDMGILKYARRWGVLALCVHQLPSTHNLPSDFLTRKAEWCQPTCREPLDVWRAFSRRAGLVVNVAAHLNQGKLFDPQQWLQTVWELDAPGESLPPKQVLMGIYGTTSKQRSRLAMLVNEWLWLADVRPALLWNKEVNALQLNFGSPYSGTLFGALGIELMLAVSGQGDFATCSGCGQPYLRAKRRPKAGQENYCTDCNERGVPVRRRVERYREKSQK
jgi:hypothetical protein